MGDLPIGMLIFFIFVIFSSYTSFVISWAWVVRQDKSFLKQFAKDFKGYNYNDGETKFWITNTFLPSRYYGCAVAGLYKGFPYIFNCILTDASRGCIVIHMQWNISPPISFEITKKYQDNKTGRLLPRLVGWHAVQVVDSILADEFKILGDEENQPKIHAFLSNSKYSKIVRELFDKKISRIGARGHDLTIETFLVQPIGWTFISTSVLEFQSSVRLYFYEILDLLTELSQEVSKIS